MSARLPDWTNDMLTTVLAQHAEWWTRSAMEVDRRVALIEQDGNILHAFAPKGPPRKAKPLSLVWEDRRKEDCEITHDDRRRKALYPPPPPNFAQRRFNRVAEITNSADLAAISSTREKSK